MEGNRVEKQSDEATKPRKEPGRTCSYTIAKAARRRSKSPIHVNFLSHKPINLQE
jgi:hypothetical protein